MHPLFSTEETSTSIRNILIHTVSLLSIPLLQRSRWPELLIFLSKCAKSSEVNKVVISLNLFKEIIINSNSEIFKNHFPFLKRILSKTLLLDNETDAQVASLDATITFLTHFSSSSERKRFVSFIPLLYHAIGNCLNECDEESARMGITGIEDVVSMDKSFCKGNLKPLIGIVSLPFTAFTLSSFSINIFKGYLFCVSFSYQCCIVIICLKKQ